MDREGGTILVCESSLASADPVANSQGWLAQGPTAGFLVPNWSPVLGLRRAFGLFTNITTVPYRTRVLRTLRSDSCLGLADPAASPSPAIR